VLYGRAPVEVSAAGGLWVVAEGWGVAESEAREVVRRGRCLTCAAALGGSPWSSPVAPVEEVRDLARRAHRAHTAAAPGALAQRASRCSSVPPVRPRAALASEQLLPAKALTYSERAMAMLARSDAVAAAGGASASSSRREPETLGRVFPG